MEENQYSGKIINFYTLLQNYKIEIPIIQRDYAQGRKDKKEIRENFLLALHKCLVNEIPIKLDFIYGSLLDNQFLPLDGQQRLTTLYLLHWYAATKSNQISKPEIKENLSKFSYETRISSREFCSELVNNSISINGDEDSISNLIVDSNWFFLLWRNDPTIDGMLRTLDHIHEIFYKIDDLWEKLNSKLIEFYFVELENMGLTDDLYIKMNARGRLLTSFENFKASFQKKIIEESWDDEKPLNETFGVKIDNDWMDFFWDHYRKNHSIDDSIIRFISCIAMIVQSINRELSSEERLEIINLLQENPKSVRPSHFNKLGYDYLVECFDKFNDYVIVHEYEKIKFDFPMWRHGSKGSILRMNVSEENSHSSSQRNSSSYTQKVLFFAQSQYLIKNSFDNDKYQDWMRVIRNLVSRGDVEKDGKRPDIVRSPATFNGMINLINELSEGSKDIYKYLSETSGLKSQYAREQVAEEIEKARLIEYNPKFRSLIFDAEDNDLLRGKISFIFYCIDYFHSPLSFNEDLFIKITNVFNNYISHEDHLNNDFRRLMLTTEVNGKFEFYTYWWSYWHIGKSNKRRLFDKFREIEYFINNEYYREYFKKIVLKLIDFKPQEIIDNFSPPQDFPNWKLRLIKEKELLDKKANTNLIAIAEDESCCYLLKSSRPREIEGNLKIE